MDFATTECDIIDVVKQALNGLRISIWINNAGIISKINKFYSIQNVDIDNEIRVNMNAVAYMTKLAIEHKTRTIVQIGSIAPFFNSPDIAHYTGTKAFINSFSKSLAGEEEVDILCVTPGFVRTKLIRAESKSTDGMNRLSWSVIDAGECANSVLNLIVHRGQVLECPSIVHYLTVVSVKFVPSWILKLVIGNSLWNME